MDREKTGQESDALAESPEFLALTPQEQKFVMEYRVDENASRAAREAGIGQTEKSSGVLGHKLLKSIKIQAALALAKRLDTKKRVKHYDISREGLLKILAEIAHNDPSRMVSVANGTATLKKSRRSLKNIKSFSYSESSGAQGSSSSFSFAVHDRVKAVETIAKMTGALDAKPDEGKEQEPVARGVSSRLAGLRSKYSTKRGSGGEGSCSS